MRHGAWRAAQTPRERVSAVIAVNFSDKQFRPETIAAWLAFYVEAQKSTALRRLLRVYARRLHSNLMSGLTPLMPRADAERIAEGIAAMIDGLYIRRALKDGAAQCRRAPIALVEDYLETKLAQPKRADEPTPEHPDHHGRPAERNAVSGRPGGLPACAASEGAGRALGALSQQLHRLAALRAGPRLVHERAIAVAHPGL